jgi:hypothetical protein
MSQTQIEFKILFRKPIYPLIVISKDKLMAAFNIKELSKCCIFANPEKEGGVIKSIDSTGEEFWYTPENYAISPGFAFKRWTKKQIIELYNSNSLNEDTKYSEKSLSSKRLERIVSDICDLLK